jgi:DNA-binding transcriptional LysR family regulator
MPTLDQLKVLMTVVDVGSFAAAARKLNRATSVVSYTIANLESQLGVALFDRESTRKPQLTDAGRTVLAEARAVSNGVDELRAKVKGLLQGLEAELHLVFDVMLPTERVADALTAFRAEFPTVALRLHVETLGAVTQLVLDRVATVGVSGPLPGMGHITGIERVGIGNVGRLADLGSKHMLLKAGIGWGNMPKPMVQEDLDSGRLVELDLPDATSGVYRFDAIYRTDAPPGPAAAWLIARLKAQASPKTATANRSKRPRKATSRR